MSKVILAGMTAHVSDSSTTLAALWRLTRRDGVQFHFTEHDQPIPFDLDGSGTASYTPRASFNRTAVRSSTGLSVDNVDLTGVFDDADIKEDELRLGLFDKATVEVFLVNWKDLTDGSIKLRKGTLGRVKIAEGGLYEAELRGLSQAASQTLGRFHFADCDADLGDDRCKIPIFPDEVSRSTAFVVGDFVRASNSKFIAQTMTNGNAETGDTTGWTNELGGLAVRSASPAPQEGSNYFFGGTSAETRARQDVTVPPAQETAVDAGNREVRIRWLQNALDEAADDQAEIQVDFLDAASAQIGATVSAGLLSPITWTERQLQTAVPAGTRTLRVRMRMVRQTGVDNDGLVDNVRVDLVDAAPTSDLFDDRIYQCTTAGTTSDVQPTYDTTLTNTTADGTAVFTAEEAWSRAVVVLGVNVGEPRKNFLVAELTPNTGGPRGGFPDDWFNQGAVTFETGNNAGRTMEVRDFVADDGITIEQQLILVLDLPFDITVGDKARVYPGCDKLQQSCIIKFDNIVNFRGFPFVPGVDELNRFPDSKS